MTDKCYAHTNEACTVSDKDLELINKYALKPLTKDEVFTFSLILCDNDIDRDYECFSEASLETLQKLFIGKTGILNHSMKSEDQSCRTYRTEVITDSEKKTADNRPYVYLKAYCYTVKSEKNASLIRDIESGIKKEVSISCNASKRICSVCGSSGCSHIPGREYNGTLCYKTLNSITDAYEWSFVAVPAQRGAGVTKSMKNTKEKNMDTILKALKEQNEITLKASEIARLSDYINALEQTSADGKKYRAALEEKAQKGFSLAMPSLSEDCVKAISQSLSCELLEALCSSLKKETSKILPPAPQLFSEKKENDTVINSEFKF